MVTKSVGDTVWVKVGVKNTSATTGVLGVDAFYNSTPIGTLNYAVDPGQTREVPFNFTAQAVGTYDIMAQVRPYGSEEVLDSKTLLGELVVQEGVVCPPSHEAFAVPGVELHEYDTESSRAVTQTFYQNEQIFARILAGGINQGDVVKWELGWIDEQGDENMWPDSTVSWTVPEQLDVIEAAAWWPEPAGSYTWQVLCPYIVKIFVNGQLLAKLYFEVVLG